MTSFPDPAGTYPELLALGLRLRAEGRDFDEILVALRARSESIIQSMKVVRALTGWRLREVKLFVHHSAAWADRREEFEALHAALARAWDEAEAQD
jgi:ribosomal protein L7/L12